MTGLIISVVKNFLFERNNFFLAIFRNSIFTKKQHYGSK